MLDVENPNHTMTDAQDILNLAHGVSDLGMLVIAAACFLLLSMGMMVACFKWFRSLIDGIIDGNNASMEKLLQETRAQNDLLNDISEGLRPETLLRIKTTSSCFFELSVEKACRMIKKIREENHIDDRQATAAKIRRMVQNLHEDRNSKFDCYSFRGRKLSEYTSREWIEQVAAVIEGELYDTQGANNGRAYTNVRTAYDNIKIDFYHKLIQ